MNWPFSEKATNKKYNSNRKIDIDALVYFEAISNKRVGNLVITLI